MAATKHLLAMCAATIAIAGCGAQTVRTTSPPLGPNMTAMSRIRAAGFDEVAATRVLAADPIPAGNVDEWVDAARSTCSDTPQLAALGLVGYLTANTVAGEGDKAAQWLQSMLAALRAGCPAKAAKIEVEIATLQGISYS